MNEKIYVVVNQNTSEGFHSVGLKAFHEYADALEYAQDEIASAMDYWSRAYGITNLEDLDDDNPPLGAVVDLSETNKGSFYIYENGYADDNEQCIYIKTIEVL